MQGIIRNGHADSHKSLVIHDVICYINRLFVIYNNSFLFVSLHIARVNVYWFVRDRIQTFRQFFTYLADSTVIPVLAEDEVYKRIYMYKKHYQKLPFFITFFLFLVVFLRESLQEIVKNI